MIIHYTLFAQRYYLIHHSQNFFLKKSKRHIFSAKSPITKASHTTNFDKQRKLLRPCRRCRPQNSIKRRCAEMWTQRLILFVCQRQGQYSSQLLISISSMGIEVKALIYAEARRAFVINGMFRSTAARRIL